MIAAKCFHRLLAIGLLSALALAGCNAQNSGPKRYPISGTVTFKGQPVPKGFITLEPHVDAGNSGPGGGAEIVNGKYSAPVATGIVGGPYKVRIVGTDGVPIEISGESLPEGQPLFAPYETTVEFAAEPTTKDFEIPAAN